MTPRGKGKKRQSHKPEGVQLVSLSLPLYEVDMTATAKAVYVDLYRKAKTAEQSGDYGNTHCSTFNMVKDAVHRLIPSDPLNRRHALREALSNVFRIRKGRMRICWIASSKLRRVLILYISETLRKEGDVHDPYVIFQNMMDRGLFDDVLQKFGVRMAALRQRTLSNKPH